MAYFINPEGLLKMGGNLYRQTDSSGAPTLSNPGQNGIGTLQQNMPGSLQRRAGHGIDRPDHHPAIVRVQLAGDQASDEMLQTDRQHAEAIVTGPMKPLAAVLIVGLALGLPAAPGYAAELHLRANAACEARW